jgi:hypothetical protein
MQTLKSDHAVLAEILDQLKIQLARPDLPMAFDSLDLFWASLAVHIRAENICLFPAVLNAPSSKFGANSMPELDDVKTTIEGLRADHLIFYDGTRKAMKSFVV